MTIRTPASLIVELLERPALEPWQRAVLRSMQSYIAEGGNLPPEQLERLQRIAHSIEGSGNDKSL